MLSCNNNDSRKSVLVLAPHLSIVEDDKFILDSLLVFHYKDSIVFMKYSNNKYFESVFMKNQNSFSEIRGRYSDTGEYFGIDTILTFSRKDTCFTYKSAYEFVPIVLSLSYADCNYIVKKTGENFVTIKQSLVDTTYKEIFFYDRNFDIYKFVNTWRSNEIVYFMTPYY